MRWGVQFEGYFEVNEVKGMGGCYKPCDEMELKVFIGVLKSFDYVLTRLHQKDRGK